MCDTCFNNSGSVPGLQVSTFDLKCIFVAQPGLRSRSLLAGVRRLWLLALFVAPILVQIFPVLGEGHCRVNPLRWYIVMDTTTSRFHTFPCAIIRELWVGQAAGAVKDGDGGSPQLGGGLHPSHDWSCASSKGETSEPGCCGSAGDLHAGGAL